MRWPDDMHVALLHIALHGWRRFICRPTLRVIIQCPKIDFLSSIFCHYILGLERVVILLVKSGSSGFGLNIILYC